MNALITGSETYGRYVTNPSKWLAVSADGREIAGYQIHSLFLPSVPRLSPDVDDAGTAIVKVAQEVEASVIVSFGLSSAVKGFQVERTATNWLESKYCFAQENNTPLDASRPPNEQLHIDLSHWDLEKMERLFEQVNIPFDSTHPNDEGRYSCNGWIYRTLVAMQRQKFIIPYLFVHTACTEESIELIPDFDRNKTIIKKEDTLKALEIILHSRDLG